MSTDAAIAEHLTWLRAIPLDDSPLISLETAEIAERAWRLIWKASGYVIPVPSAGTGPDGVMFYAWNRGRHHLELEIIPGQPAEWFYRDREGGPSWSEDWEVLPPVPQGAVERMGLFD